MDFTKLTAYLESLHTVNVPGCDLIVYRDHEVLYRHQAGYRDLEQKDPILGNETYRFYSATKVFTTCAAMQLIEKGKLFLDDPVSLYLPAYANLTVKDGDEVRPAKTVMTVRHLMSMQSGLNYDLGSPAIKKMMEETHGLATTRQLMEAKAQDPLEFDPGRDFLYSLSHDALAAVIEAASGQRFSDYIRDNIWSPLGISRLSFDLEGYVAEHMCMQYNYIPAKDTVEEAPVTPHDYRPGVNYESGGAGIIGCVADYALFTDAIACGGVGANGNRILSKEMIQLWSSNQLGPQSRKTFDKWKRIGYSYGLGVRTRVDDLIGGAGAVGEFGWDGAAGAYAMIDPHNRISAFFGMHVKNHSYVYNVVHPSIRSLIYEALQ